MYLKFLFPLLISSPGQDLSSKPSETEIMISFHKNLYQFDRNSIYNQKYNTKFNEIRITEFGGLQRHKPCIEFNAGLGCNGGIEDV